MKANGIIIYLYLFALKLVPGLAIAQDNAVELVRLVRKNHQSQYNGFQSVSFSGISRHYLYGSWQPKFNIISDYEEYYFEGYWMKPDSLRIVIKALRRVIVDQPAIMGNSRNDPAQLQKVSSGCF